MEEKRFPWNRVVIICAVVAGSIVWRYMGLAWGIPMVFALVGTAMLVAYVYHRIETRLMTTEELFEEHKELLLSGTECSEEDLGEAAKLLGVAPDAIGECLWVPCVVKWDVGSSPQLYVCSISELLSKSRTRDDRGFVAVVEREGVELAIFSPSMTSVAWLRGGRETPREVIGSALEEGRSLIEAAAHQGWEG